jgi:hypothetical protein
MEDCLIRIINSLEGYRLELHNNKLSKEETSCLEKLMSITIVTAKEYGYKIEPYDKWFSFYTSIKKHQEGKQTRLVFNE